MDLVIGTRANPAVVEHLVGELKTLALSDATLYVGYPILSTADHPISLDAILTCLEHGVVVFDLSTPPDNNDWNEVEERQGELEIALKSKLLRHKELTEKRDLAVPIRIVTYLPHRPLGPSPESLIIAVRGRLAEALSTLSPMDPKYVRPLNASIQQVTTIKPVRKRLSVKQEGSRGGRLKVIEREIANLDRWQKKGAIECPDGPQRIRGLAGSGKTVVLALKAAYLHAQHPEWNIAVGFQTRSLYGQFRDLIRRFTFEHIGDEPNWERLRVLHAWGGAQDPGIYSLITAANGLAREGYAYGASRYGSANAFESVCGKALSELRHRSPKAIFDAVLIDEAQDFGPNFFQLAYSSVKEPRRFVFAYDELQSLRETSLPGLAELFGVDANGEPRVKLANVESQPLQDVVLPTCYRNTPWTLTIAHALGFGVYRAEGLIQMFDEPSMWNDIGYQVESGSLTPGRSVTLARKPDATPQFFSTLLTPEDAVQSHFFNNEEEQAAWVAERIQANLDDDELEPSDILVIPADPRSAHTDAGPLVAELRAREIPHHVAGVTSGVDDFFVSGSVTISGIHRAKGNEAPMVYVLGAEYCQEGGGLIKRRNVLFTALTRSRAWVRVCGIGPKMKQLQQEWKAVIDKGFTLSFTVPTPEELKRIRRIHRDRTEEEIQQTDKDRKSLEAILDRLEGRKSAWDDLPDRLKKRIAALRGDL